MKLSKTALRFLNQQYRAVLLACLLASFGSVGVDAALTGIEVVKDLNTESVVKSVATETNTDIARTDVQGSTTVAGTRTLETIAEDGVITTQVVSSGTKTSVAKFDDLKNLANLINASGTGVGETIEEHKVAGATKGQLTYNNQNVVSAINRMGKMLTEGEGVINLSSAEMDNLIVGTSGTSPTGGSFSVTNESGNSVFAVDGKNGTITLNGVVDYTKGLKVEKTSEFGTDNLNKTVIAGGVVTSTGQIEAGGFKTTGIAELASLKMPAFSPIGASTSDPVVVTSIDNSTLENGGAFSAKGGVAGSSAPETTLATAATVLNSAQNAVYLGNKIDGITVGSGKRYTIKEALSDTVDQTNKNTNDIAKIVENNSELLGTVDANSQQIVSLNADVTQHEKDIKNIREEITVPVSIAHATTTTLSGAISGLDTALTTAEGKITTLTGDATVTGSVRNTVKTEAANATFVADANTSTDADGKLDATTLGEAINQVAQNYIQADENILKGKTNFTGLKLVDDGSAGFSGLEMIDKTILATPSATPVTTKVKYIANGVLSADSALEDQNKQTLATADAVVKTIQEYTDGVGTKNTAAAGEPSTATGLFADVEANTTAIANLTDGTTKLTGLTMDTLTAGTTATVNYITNDAVDAAGTDNDKTLATAKSVLDTVNAHAGEAFFEGSKLSDDGKTVETVEVADAVKIKDVLTATNTRVADNTTRVATLEDGVGSVDFDVTGASASLKDKDLTEAVLELDDRINKIGTITGGTGTVDVAKLITNDILATADQVAHPTATTVSDNTAASTAYVKEALKYKGFGGGTGGGGSGGSGGGLVVLADPTPVDDGDYDHLHKLDGTISEDFTAAGAGLEDVLANTVKYLNKDTDLLVKLTGDEDTEGSIENTVKTKAENAVYTGTKVTGSEESTIGGVLNATVTKLNTFDADVSKIGNGDFSGAHYLTSGTANLTDAVKTLDSELSRIDGRMDHYDKKIKDMDDKMKSGFASLAAMSALQPNARACSDTQISLGTGTYKGQVGLAVGAFHYFHDNLMMNVGGSFAGNDSTTFRGGITFGW